MHVLNVSSCHASRNLSHSPFKSDKFAKISDSYALPTTVPEHTSNLSYVGELVTWLPAVGHFPLAQLSAPADRISWVKAQLWGHIGRFMHFNWIGSVAPRWERFFEAVMDWCSVLHTTSMRPPAHFRDVVWETWALHTGCFVNYMRMMWCQVQMPWPEWPVRRAKNSPSDWVARNLIPCCSRADQGQSQSPRASVWNEKYVCLRNKRKM